jgi:hypothetical protein
LTVTLLELRLLGLHFFHDVAEVGFGCDGRIAGFRPQGDVRLFHFLTNAHGRSLALVGQLRTAGLLIHWRPLCAGFFLRMRSVRCKQHAGTNSKQSTFPPSFAGTKRLDSVQGAARYARGIRQSSGLVE